MNKGSDLTMNERMEKKDRIKKLATILFAEKGIRNTTIRDISKFIGIALGGIYYYYSSKEELLKDIFNEALENRQFFLSQLADSKDDFNTKIKKIISRRLLLEKDRHYLFLFAKVSENEETHLLCDDFANNDKLFITFLLQNIENIKEEYHDDIPKLGYIINAALKKHLNFLIDKIGIKADDENSYNLLIERYNQLDIEKEIKLFYGLFFKNLIKE